MHKLFPDDSLNSVFMNTHLPMPIFFKQMGIHIRTEEAYGVIRLYVSFLCFSTTICR